MLPATAPRPFHAREHANAQVHHEGEEVEGEGCFGCRGVGGVERWPSSALEVERVRGSQTNHHPNTHTPPTPPTTHTIYSTHIIRHHTQHTQHNTDSSSRDLRFRAKATSTRWDHTHSILPQGVSTDYIHTILPTPTHLGYFPHSIAILLSEYITDTPPRGIAGGEAVNTTRRVLRTDPQPVTWWYGMGMMWGGGGGVAVCYYYVNRAWMWYESTSGGDGGVVP